MFNKKKIKINSDYVAEEFDSEILLYDKIGSQAVYLNNSAYAVLLLCKENFTVDQVVEYLKKKYPEREGQIQSDVKNAITLLEEHKVITLSNDD